MTILGWLVNHDSGAGSGVIPPLLRRRHSSQVLLGDYEAQRHWMEITLNLTYWGLDYPSLTAYQSYIHALFLQSFDPGSVALFSSRGYESNLGKLLM